MSVHVLVAASDPHQRRASCEVLLRLGHAPTEQLVLDVDGRELTNADVLREAAIARALHEPTRRADAGAPRGPAG